MKTNATPFFLFVILILLLHVSCKTKQNLVPEKRKPNTVGNTSDELYNMNRTMPSYLKDKELFKELLKKHAVSAVDYQHIDTLKEMEMHYFVFPLKVVMVINKDKPKYVSKAKIEKGLNILNRGLVNCWVQFQLIGIDTLSSKSTINALKSNSYAEYYRFSKLHDSQDTCTLYLFDNDDELCEKFSCARTQGFANILETYTNNVVLDKFFIDDYKVIVHEFGHYFGLYHTAETTFGIEKVSGENCKTTGDKICDTPADPGELYNVYVNYSNCEMKGFKESGSGLEYRPMIDNYMSYYNHCYYRPFRFSQGQLDVMLNAAIQIRHNQIVLLAEMPLFY